MTWKRVATAVVLIPFVVGLVVWGSTAIVSLAVALLTMLALFEYFALGEAIGHRAYRFWTATCALLILYLQWFMQWLSTVTRWSEYGDVGYPGRLVWLLVRMYPPSEVAFFVFVLGVAAITLFTKRP